MRLILGVFVLVLSGNGVVIERVKIAKSQWPSADKTPRACTYELVFRDCFALINTIERSQFIRRIIANDVANFAENGCGLDWTNISDSCELIVKVREQLGNLEVNDIKL